MRLAWTERDGGDLLDLSGTGPAGAVLYLSVKPHPEPGYFRPLFVLAPGEEERELGDGVLGREHARDTLVKLAISELARRHDLPAGLFQLFRHLLQCPIPGNPDLGGKCFAVHDGQICLRDAVTIEICRINTEYLL